MGNPGKKSAGSEGSKAEPTAPAGDVALVFGKNEQGLHILRRRDENSPIEAGLLQPLVEGRPITGELISMRRREDTPLLYDVKSEIAAPEAARAPGPSKVTSDSYRKGWDAIWGRRGGSSNRDVN